MKLIIAYTNHVKEMKWDDFKFNLIKIKTLPPLEAPEYYKNSFIFKDSFFAPNTKGTSGQIIRYGGDQEIGYIEADSIHTFIKSLMENQGEIEDSEWYGERLIC